MASPLLLLPLPLLLLAVALYFITTLRPVHVPIKNRHVFVTGGSSGIGLAIARQAAAAGARVSILARSKAKLEDARDSIKRATGVDVAIYSADVRDMEAVRSAIEEAGTIDVLVCNQGVYHPRELDEDDMEDIKFTLDVNLLGTFHLIKAALPAMKQSDGKPRSIALMSSQSGQVGIYGYTSYCASKFALRGLGEALQQEVFGDDIHISIIYPPDTDTPGFEEELKIKSEINNTIANSSVLMKADDVAKKSIEGITSGEFTVSCNLEGKILSLSSASLSPQRSLMMAFLEVVFAGAMRFVGLCVVNNWYAAIEKCRAMKKRKLNLN